MTNPTTALTDALRDTLDFVERHSNRWDGVNGKHPQEVVEAARAALAAPAPALDAPADDLLEAAIDASDGAWHDGEFRIEGRALMNLLRDAAARASQPTPAQDAAATVPGWLSTVLDELPGQQRNQQQREIAARLVADIRAAAPPAPQVVPTAAPELLEALKTCHDALVRIREAGGASTSAEIVAERAIASAAPTAQAPALVPLTENQVMACLVEAKCIGKVWMSTERGVYSIDRPTAKAMRFAQAIEAARGITPAGTTPKEQQ